LAYSTVSQLGYMFLGLGVGAYNGAFFHVITHAFFKALLFLCAGSVIHALHHQQDMRHMGGLRKKLPITFVTMLIGTIAIAGLPPFSGFFSKDEILAHVYQHNPVYWAIAVFGAVLTAFYMFRMLFLTFYGTYRGTHHAEEKIHEAPKTMTIPLIILAALSAIGGIIGVPEALGGHHWLSTWLAPVIKHQAQEMPHATEYMLMAVSVAAVTIAIALAFVKYIKQSHVPIADEGKRSILANISYHKFYLDEVYETIIAKPLDAFSRFFYRVIDKKVIDGVVNGLGWGANEASKNLRLLQSGNVGFYIFMMVFGIIALLLYTYLSIS
jgi:NADH-quinone oxidoreductase subunit L